MSRIRQDSPSKSHFDKPSSTVYLQPCAVDDDPVFQSLITELVAEGSAQAVLQPIVGCSSLPGVQPLIHCSHAQLSGATGEQPRSSSKRGPSPALEAKQRANPPPRRKPGRPAKDPGQKTAAWVLKIRRAQQRFRDKQKV